MKQVTCRATPPALFVAWKDLFAIVRDHAGDVAARLVAAETGSVALGHLVRILLGVPRLALRPAIAGTWQELQAQCPHLTRREARNWIMARAYRMGEARLLAMSGGAR